ncbi:MAG TPA: hypothetical protein VFH56_10790 [Acidimicrobiales bacterium]|nr:hypothetical protein [Acidimicrobiales bacterium]
MVGSGPLGALYRVGDGEVGVVVMEKVVVLLVGDGPCPPPELLEELVGSSASQLRRRGASRVQVNVIDPELGHPHGIAPGPGDVGVSSMVSYWVEAAGEHGIHADILPGGGPGSWYGYLVAEAVQLAGPPAPGDGTRSTGFTQIVPLGVPKHLSWAEWRRRWQGEHTAVAIDTQSSFRYVQNLVVRPLDDGAPAFAAVVEESFPTGAASDTAVFYDADGNQERLADNSRRMMESCAKFIDGLVPIAWTAEYRLPD